MDDSRSISGAGPLREHFARQAVLPQQDLLRAQEFLTALENADAPPSPSQFQTGKALLESLEEKAVRYAFGMAQLIAQEANSPTDLDKRVEAAGRNLEVVEKTAQKLRATLGKSV